MNLLVNNNIPLSLYIHFPWCIRKCPYCDFNSHTLKQDLPEQEYISTLLRDLDHDLNNFDLNNRPIHSIFMGGGTPSLFSPESIYSLLKSIQSRIDFKSNLEITLEANPGTFEQDKFLGFRQAGINRLSIGIQSFQKEKLKALGRIHDDEAALRAINIAKQAGFENFNIDLMHGLPNQNLDDAMFDIKSALGFLPPHISWYQLTLEPNTLFFQKPPVLPDENILGDINQLGGELLSQHNYSNYEISAHCQPGRECQHNVNYWEFGDYLGIGAGAHGKIGHTRIAKIKHPKEYLTKDFIASQAPIENNQLAFEFMLNTLRLKKLISWELFAERTNLDPKDILDKLNKLADKKLMIISNNGFELTNLGQRFLNDVLTNFL
ncbi:MAG TPA: radical SAM family heme chaperone HemW [Gammaproteobacteria bacterium]|nr:radical SAM family heme chaperone HemW [Gammaproteobacteria bacterium]